MCIPFNSEVHEPAPTRGFVHLHRIRRYPAVFTVFNGDSKVVERSEEAEVSFHVLRGDKRPQCTLCSNDIGRRSGGRISRGRASHVDHISG